MTNPQPASDQRLIERGFPCHQVGAETERERGASSALPPLYFLHVWWARRPLTPSRAAILASLLPADADPEQFVRSLGIEIHRAVVGRERWIIAGKVADLVELRGGREILDVTKAKVVKAFHKENERRTKARETIAKLRENAPWLASHPVVQRWQQECQPLTLALGIAGGPSELVIERGMGDPAHISERIAFANQPDVVEALGGSIRWSPEEMFAYDRAFAAPVHYQPTGKVVLDPTAGGGSIPFEALRLGHTVIANDLNPVASVIHHATLDFPARFGPDLVKDIQHWGEKLEKTVNEAMRSFYHFAPIPPAEVAALKQHCAKCPELVQQFSGPEYDQNAQIFARQIICPHCQGEVPLLNTCWLSKDEEDQWGVAVTTDGKAKSGKIAISVYRAVNGKGPNGEDPETRFITDGDARCPHCKQGIDGDEVKAQARGESPQGKWTDRLYAIASVRYQPSLDDDGLPQRFATGDRAGALKTKKVRFFRTPVQEDNEVIAKAEREMVARWDAWEAEGLIPIEEIGSVSNYDRGHRLYGMNRWCDFFTSRQLLGHVMAAASLIKATSAIQSAMGFERGKAVVTYLQFALDKVLDYNSKCTRWHFGRGVIVGTFGRHDYSLKWTFGEMAFSGAGTSLSWGISQITEAYEGIADMARPIFAGTADGASIPLRLTNGSAAHMPDIANNSVDLVVMDPPYYDNVMYAELSDYFYVWQKRTLKDLYGDLFLRNLTNKADEAVANRARDGGGKEADSAYERMMAEIFTEARRTVKSDGLLSLMFTHKSQDAWAALTTALIRAGWTITACFPVDSEGSNSMHQRDVAAAASSVFLACRKRPVVDGEPSQWQGFAGQGVVDRVRTAVAEGLTEFARLKLNPVDEMVAGYGRALRVLSEAWPVFEGEAEVSPQRAMTEASRVVAQHQIRRLTQGSLTVDDLTPEAAFALTCFGIYGLGEFAYDDARNLANSLTLALEQTSAGYTAEGRIAGINTATTGGRGRKARAESVGYHAPLVRKGSKLTLAKPEERSPERLDHPQHEWDLLHGTIMQFRAGDVPVARAYLQKHAGNRQPKVMHLLAVWGATVGDPELRKEADRIAFGLNT